MSDPWLQLDNQLCFPFYAVSRLITRLYGPLLEELGLTYPQYLVLLALWERDGVSVGELSDRLILETNTLTPLLKRLEKQGRIRRRRSDEDERVVLIELTPEGAALQTRAASVPRALVDALAYPPEDLLELRDSVGRFLEALRSGGEDAGGESGGAGQNSGDDNRGRAEGIRKTGAAGQSSGDDNRGEAGRTDAKSANRKSRSAARSRGQRSGGPRSKG